MSSPDNRANENASRRGDNEKYGRRDGIGGPEGATGRIPPDWIESHPDLTTAKRVTDDHGGNDQPKAGNEVNDLRGGHIPILSGLKSVLAAADPGIRLGGHVTGLGCSLWRPRSRRFDMRAVELAESIRHRVLESDLPRDLRTPVITRPSDGRGVCGCCSDPIAAA